MSENRVGIIGIIIEQREINAPKVNAILTEFGEIIQGRIGLPYKAKGFHIIALIVDGSMDAIGAMTGKLGMLSGVRVKSAIAN
jgi:putative iron-only hydrogenase system regulator